MKKFLFYLLLFTVIFIAFFTQPVDRNSTDNVVVSIEKGTSSREIARILWEKELIHSEKLFLIFSFITGKDGQLQAGYYELSQADSLIDILDDLAYGNIATFRITIPEGFTVEEIADSLGKITDFEAEVFLDIARDPQFLEPFAIPEQGQYYLLEGLLYPDTYIIPRGFDPESILQVLFKEFEKKWWPILQQASEQFSAYQLLTVASLIEKESRLKEEKPLIASVIYNRLQEGMKLQLDATIQYLLEERQQVILYRHLEEESLFNTYLHHGLPPGPIGSPGENAIRAALEPASSDFFFYFAVNDGSHVFSKNYQQHLERLTEFREKRDIDGLFYNGGVEIDE